MSGYREGMTEADQALFTAAVWGDGARARDALERGARPNILDADGQTPLHALGGSAQAIEADRLAAFVKLLLDAGADLDALDSAGRSPLSVAARSYRPNAARALLIMGCSLRGALFCASEYNYGAEIPSLLLSAGASPFELGPNGLTPLEAAKSAWGGPNLETVALLEAAELRFQISAPPLSPANPGAPRL